MLEEYWRRLGRDRLHWNGHLCRCHGTGGSTVESSAVRNRGTAGPKCYWKDAVRIGGESGSRGVFLLKSARGSRCRVAGGVGEK